MMSNSTAATRPARAALPRFGRWKGIPKHWQQAALMGAIIAATATTASFGAGLLAKVLFIGSALLAAGFYARRSPWLYVTMTFWFWTLTPLVRRLIDFHAGFDPVNIVLATPNLMTLFMLKDILASRDLLRRREALAGLLLAIPIGYGLVISLVQGEVVPGLVASADWVGPLLYFFYFIANWKQIDGAEIPFRGFLALNGFVVIAYGLYQYFSPLPWDVSWVINSGMTSIGHPAAYQLRVFSTLNAPGVLAIWIGAILLLFLHFRSKITGLLASAGAMLLLMTLVRSAAGAVLMGLLLAGIMGRARALKPLGMAALLAIAGGSVIAVLNPKIVDQFSTRFATLEHLSQDDSAFQREAIYRAAPSLIAANSLGLGIGALGRGAVASDNSNLVVVDSGPLAIYLALGWVAGTLYMIGIVWTLAQSLVAARVSGSSAALALAVAALAGSASLLFVGMTGLYAATVWTCAAYAIAIGIAHRNAGHTTSQKSRGFLPPAIPCSAASNPGGGSTTHA